MAHILESYEHKQNTVLNEKPINRLVKLNEELKFLEDCAVNHEARLEKSFTNEKI